MSLWNHAQPAAVGLYSFGGLSLTEFSALYSRGVRKAMRFGKSHFLPALLALPQFPPLSQLMRNSENNWENCCAVLPS